MKRNVNGTETWQVYGLAGELLAEYASNTDASTPQKEYGYRSGQLLVTAEPNAQVHWLVTDQLGTPRMIFDNTGSLSGVSRHDYLPFGEEAYVGLGVRTAAMGYGGDATRQKFTQKERDIETGLDYFVARYYSSAQGRFTSPDEFSGGPDELFEFEERASDNPMFYADTADPQSLNKYQYAYNNPLRFVDPDGHQGWETVKKLARGAVDTQIGVDKSGANIAIGASNIGGEAVGHQAIEPFRPSGKVPTVTMIVADRVFLIAPLLFGKSPANVMIADSEETSVAAARVGNATRSANQAKSAAEMAEELASQTGKNSVSYRTPNKTGRIDLQGKAHFDKPTGQRIATPHVHEKTLNFGPEGPSGGRVNASRQVTRSATRQDIRTARKIIERQ